MCEKNSLAKCTTWQRNTPVMATAADLIENLSRLDLTTLSASCVNNTAEDYVVLNRAQMMEGKGEGKNIGRYRSTAYAQFKFGLSSLAGMGNVDLRLTGSFQDKMRLTVAGDEYTVDSSDSKTSKLESADWYGGNIFGLNVKRKSEYIEQALEPEFEIQVEKATGLKFG